MGYSSLLFLLLTHHMLGAGGRFRAYVTFGPSMPLLSAFAFCFVELRIKKNDKGKWTIQRLPGNAKVSRAQCIVLDKAILMAGSFYKSKSYIFEKGKWRDFMDMPAANYRHEVVLVGDMLFAFYGHKGKFCLKLNESGKKWEKSKVEGDKSYMGRKMVSRDGYIFVAQRKRWMSSTPVKMLGYSKAMIYGDFRLFVPRIQR